MAKFKPGESRPKNAGRKKGTPNKIAKSAKEAIEKAVEEIGGWKELAKWAKKNNRNQEKLYDWYFKMLPTNVGVDHSGQIKTDNTVTVKVIHVQSKKNGKKENGSDNK